MAFSPVPWRWMLALSAVLVIGVAVVVAVGVIPPVGVSTSPDITPESAVTAFWVSAGLQLLAALALLLIAVLSKCRSWGSTSGLVVTGVVVLFLGFALGDAALAFREAQMQSVATLLVLCVAADALAAVLTVTTAFLRPKKPRESLTSASAVSR